MDAQASEYTSKIENYDSDSIQLLCVYQDKNGIEKNYWKKNDDYRKNKNHENLQMIINYLDKNGINQFWSNSIWLYGLYTLYIRCCGRNIITLPFFSSTCVKSL